MSFRAVLFDLDGTLCEQTQSAQEIYKSAFNTAGIEPFGAPEELWAALAEPPDHEDRVGYFAAGFAIVAAKHGQAPVDATALARGLLDVIDYTNVRPRSGAEAAVRLASANGPIGVVTNGPAEVQTKKLNELPFGDDFATVVCAADHPRKKPNSEPFDRALTVLSVRAEATLFVGDSLEYDVAGAQNAGLTAAWCPREGTDPGRFNPEYILESPAEISRIPGIDC